MKLVAHISRTLRNSSKLIAYCLLVCCILCLSSCFKEKPYAPPSDTPIGQTAVIPMMPEYNNQFFYNLETNAVVGTSPRAAYHLMFDCAPDKFNIWMNTSMFMSLIRTDETVFSQVSMQDTVGEDWRYEYGSFNADSNAIGEWWQSAGSEPVSKGKIYIVNLGVNNDGELLGYIKLRVNNFSGGTYSITYQAFGSIDSTTFTVGKDASKNYRYLSFTNNIGIVDVEPEKANWDLCFTRYSVGFYNVFGVSFLPYLVTGVLSNPDHTTAYMDSTIAFDSVTISDFNFNRLQSRRDAIGFEWKRYSGFTETGTYSMNPHYIYYIKTDEDEYYKLRFLEFSKDGVRGYPTFEYYRL